MLPLVRLLRRAPHGALLLVFGAEFAASLQLLHPLLNTNVSLGSKWLPLVPLQVEPRMGLCVRLLVLRLRLLLLRLPLLKLPGESPRSVVFAACKLNSVHRWVNRMHGSSVGQLNAFCHLSRLCLCRH